WLSGQQWRWQFPNDTSQGVYNAALKLFYDGQGQLESVAPFSQQVRACRQDSSSPIHVERLPLWLSAVGRNDLWPIKLLNQEGATKDNSFVSSSPVFYSKSLVFGSIPVALLIAYVSYVMFCVFFPQNLRFLPQRLRSSARRAAGRFRRKHVLEFCT